MKFLAVVSYILKNNLIVKVYIAQWKTIYDQYGEDVLRTGVKDQEGSHHGGYIY